MSTLPNIVILATGGTIAGIAGSTTTTVGYTAAAITVESLIEMVPEIEAIANISGQQVVQQNSATAQDSAAASEEMSSQSDVLKQLITQFKLKDDNNPIMRLGPQSDERY